VVGTGELSVTDYIRQVVVFDVVLFKVLTVFTIRRWYRGVKVGNFARTPSLAFHSSR
jgi:hypothetical protein